MPSKSPVPPYTLVQDTYVLRDPTGIDTKRLTDQVWKMHAMCFMTSSWPFLSTLCFLFEIPSCALPSDHLDGATSLNI